MADDDGPNNVIHFPRVGYTAPADPPAEPPAQAPADVPFAAPAPTTAEPFALATRTDPIGVIAALPDPGQGAPFATDPGTTTAPAATGAAVPATFRSEGAQAAPPPGLGSLSLAAILAVSLAAMRGIHSSIEAGRASREQREAVAKTASSGKDGASKDGVKKPVPSGPEYGRKALESGSGGSSGRSGGGGPGRSGRGGSGPLSGSGGRGRGGSTTKSPSGSGGGRGRGSGGGSGSGSGSGGGGRTNSPTKNGSGSGGGGRTNSPPKNGSGITPLKRNSHGGGHSLKKSRNPGSGSGKGPNNGGGGGGKNRGPGGGGTLLTRKRGPGSNGAGAGGSSGGPKKKHGPGSGTGTGKTTGPNPGKGTGGKTTPTTKGTGPGKGTGSGKGAGGKTTPGASSSKGPGSGKGTGAGPKSGTKKSPRGTTGPSGILRKKPGTTTPGTGPKTKPKGKGGSGSGPTTAPGSKRGGKKSKPRSGKGGTGPASVPKAPGGKSRKGKKQVLTPGIAHGTFASSVKQDCRCRACRGFKKEYSRKVLGAMKSAARGRTTFGEAVHETAEKRLKRRRKKMGPPIVTKVKVRKPKKKSGPKTKTTKPGSTKPAGPAAKAPSGPAGKAPSGPAAKAPARRTPWSTAKARARKRARMHTTTVPAPATSTTIPAPPAPPAPPGPPAAAPAPATAAAAPVGAATAPPSPPGAPGPAAVAPGPPAAPASPSTAPASVGGGTVPGTGQQRLTPFEAMGLATAVPAQAGPITVERADSPEPSPTAPGAGGPADNPSTKENSVSTAPDTRDSWLAQWGSGGIADMDAQHQTEVTLDDSLDVLEELTQQSFTAHETCNKLATKARQIRYELEDLAADLRSTHNVIGRLTGAAMAKLAESMEVLARKADEMATKSLTAAELSESAENAMFDAYRPLQQATEDTGLAVPAARVHNQN
ncbi:hypothetical protein [Streptomyces sp. NPDC088180]|uniref:hypothetical protein n=1 Tax=Streptomyces sp. NPDC088180 TaxID=3365837 RepID=UPI003820DBC1